MDLDLKVGLVRIVESLKADPSFRDAVSALEADLGAAKGAFLWKVLRPADLPRPLPEGFRSAWLFVLRKDTPSVAHRHPNSLQVTFPVGGRGRALVGVEEVELDASRPDDAPLTIPPGVAHEFFPEGRHMAVVSFHSAEAGELLEVDADSGRERRYLRRFGNGEDTRKTVEETG